MKYLYELSHKIRKEAKNDQSFKNIMHIILEEVCVNIVEHSQVKYSVSNSAPKSEPKQTSMFSTWKKKNPDRLTVEQDETVSPILFTGTTPENIQVMNSLTGEKYKKIDSIPSDAKTALFSDQVVFSIPCNDVFAHVTQTDNIIRIELYYKTNNEIVASLEYPVDKELFGQGSDIIQTLEEELINGGVPNQDDIMRQAQMNDIKQPKKDSSETESILNRYKDISK